MSSYAWCRRLVEALEAADVQDLVVSPGSRSTPLLLAALQSNLRIHSVIDERSAAFFALGRTRAEGRPTAFLCTSGSAGAHALPALLEARYAEHRVIAITADRPPELHGCGANQTIDQEQLFAAACPPCLDLHVPEASERAALAMRRRVYQAIVLASGPLHINLPFRKPLEPSQDEVAGPLPSRVLALLHPSQNLVPQETIEWIAEQCGKAKRGVIIAGPAQDCGPGLLALAEALNFVLLAESTSGARFTGEAQAQRCDAFPHIAQAALHSAEQNKRLAPDLVLQFGAEPACTSMNRWMAEQLCPVIRFRNKIPMGDPSGNHCLVMGEVIDLCQRLSAEVTPNPASAEFLQSWREEDEKAWAEVAHHIDSSSASEAASKSLGEAKAMAAILQSMPESSQLTLGNSMPIRSADMVLPGHKSSLRVIHQRGTSGIDGLIAGAFGSCGSERSYLLLGDVSCSHDLASLALASLARSPLTIFLIDNQGGQIFSHLPIAKSELAQGEQDLWRSPPTVDFKLAAASHHLPYRNADCLESLQAAIAWSQAEAGSCLVHVTVAPTSMLEFVQRMRESSRP